MLKPPVNSFYQDSIIDRHLLVLANFLDQSFQGDTSGKLGYDEFKELITDLRRWKVKFCHFLTVIMLFVVFFSSLFFFFFWPDALYSFLYQLHL